MIDIPQFLERFSSFYVNNKGDCVFSDTSSLDTSDIVLYKVNSVTFKKDAPRREALENVLSSLRIEGINFVYLVLGNQNGINFYYGIVKDYFSSKETEIDIDEIGEYILEPSIKGNFRGSDIVKIKGQEKREIISSIRQSTHCSMIEGVPGILNDENDFQGVDRLANVMSVNTKFGFMIIASLLNDEDLENARRNIFSAYEELNLISKTSKQEATSNNETLSTNETQSSNKTLSSNESTSNNKSTSSNTTLSNNETLSHNTTTSSNKSTSTNETLSSNKTGSTNESVSKSNTIGTNNTINKSQSTTNGQSQQESSSNSHSKSEVKSNSTSSTKTTSDNGTSKSTSTSGQESKQNSDQTSRQDGTSSSRTNSSSKTQNESRGESKSQNETTNNTKSTSESKTTSTSNSKGESTTQGESNTKGTSNSKGESTQKGESTSAGTSSSKGESETRGTSETKSTSNTKSTTNTITLEEINKQVQDWLSYIDETLLPRFDYGSGKGMFVSGMFCFADSKPILKKLENTAISLFSGEKGNKVPLRAFLIKNETKLEAIKNLQLPCIKAQGLDSRLSALISQNTKRLGNIISSKELSLIAGLPKNDVIGLELKEEVEFGLNFKRFDNELELGRLVQSGNIMDKQVGIDKNALDKHIFITGVTGSGKTTTCQNILTGSNLPFLVIEPAKTEYRILLNQYSDLLIFTLGKDSIAPFRLNPFEFFEHESITSRVDMIKASIEAAFDMEAAIPQIIESAIYECYRKKGWNIATNKNERYENPFAKGINSFPTLDDLLCETEEVVKKQGFDDRLKNDYIGSIKARLNGLLVGSKGFMLNTKRSIDFRELLNKRVVFELEEIRNGAEKSLVMGFILTNLLEAIKANFMAHTKHELKHIILIEEAHRLLSKYQPGDSLNKKQGVEVFTDMLAEIRKYGECLMVADQIPNKLSPEVLKNTNTKIVHRIFAADDKEAIANTMALEEEQAAFLSKLEVGRAILFSGGFNKAVAVQINQCSNTTDEIISDETIHNNILAFYADTAKSGVIVGSAFMDSPNTKDIENLLAFQREASGSIRFIKTYQEGGRFDKAHQKILKKYEFLGIDLLAKIFMQEHEISDDKLSIAKDFIQKYLDNSFEDKDVRYFNDGLFDAKKSV